MLALSSSVFPSPESMEADTSSSTMSPADHRFCANTLKKLQNNQHSAFFREPVDPVLLNCPDYFTIIKNPMDLSSVQRKLEHEEYDSVDAFVSDIRLMFDNCHKYNNPQDYVALEGKKLEEVFDRLLAKRPSRLVNGIENEMTEEEYRRCEGAIKEMKKKKHNSISWAFKKPVDASAWGATDYYEIIKRPMDLETLENKLKAFLYPNEESFEEDVRLIFNNCYTYNPPGHPVNTAGKQLEAIFEAYWAKAHKKASTKGERKHKRSEKPKNEPLAGVHVEELDAPVKSEGPEASLDNINNKSSSNGAPPTILRLKLSAPKEVKKEDREQVSPQSQAFSSSSALPSTSASASQQKPLAISKEPPPPPASQRPLALSATKPATKSTTGNKQPFSYLPGQRRPSDDLKKPIPDTRKRELPAQANKYPPGKRPRQHAVTTPSPPPAPPKKAPANVVDIDTLFNSINNESRIREQERIQQRKQEEERERSLREEQLRKAQMDERMTKEQQEKMRLQRARDQMRRMEALNATTIDISKSKLMFQEFERLLHHDSDWRDMISWHRGTIDYRHIVTPAFIRRRGEKCIVEAKKQLLSNIVRLRPNYNGLQEREGEQDMDVE